MSTYLSQEEIERYQRQMLLEDIGEAGQHRLKNSAVLLVGLGGIGSPLSLYLASAGVGHLGLIDNDVIERSNLQRQILYTEHDIKQSKVDVAKSKLLTHNPHIQITSYDKRLTHDNACEILSSYDLIIDGSDNFYTRYVVNDAAKAMKKPFISASIFQYSGQLAFFNVNDSACLRCLYPKPLAQNAVPNCQLAGVLGVVPGLLGTLAANEALKYLLGTGSLLVNRILTLDSHQLNFHIHHFAKNKQCRACIGEYFVDLPDINIECSPNKNEITVPQFKKNIARNEKMIVIDIREDFAYQRASIENSIHIPINQLVNYAEGDKNCPVICYCQHGHQSQKALTLLALNGYTNTRSLLGGFTAWQQYNDESNI